MFIYANVRSEVIEINSSCNSHYFQQHKPNINYMTLTSAPVSMDDFKVENRTISNKQEIFFHLESVTYFLSLVFGFAPASILCYFLLCTEITKIEQRKQSIHV